MSSQRHAIAVLPPFLRPLVLDDQERLGAAHDGGYVLPRRLLEASKTLLSFGINLDWRFELDVARRFPAVQIESFDASTTLSKALWWGVTRFLYSPISRRREHLMAFTKPVDYFSYIRHARVRHHAQFIGPRAADDTAAVADVLAVPDIRDPILVKMDIEGAEYEVLDALLPSHDRIAGLVVEFHDLDRRFSDFRSLVTRVRRHYHVTHVHANNAVPLSVDGMPQVLEITFLRHELAPHADPWGPDTYRLPMDAPNLPGLPDIDIRFDGDVRPGGPDRRD